MPAQEVGFSELSCGGSPFLRNGEFFLGSSAATAGDKTTMEDDTMGAIKELRDITENDVKEAWSALRERRPLIFHTATNAPN